jgi:membrane protein DedA with SNARE-associated domain
VTSVVDKILNLDPTLVYVVVTLLVFAEDAIFVGFVLPGETAAVLGGVVASHGRVHLSLLIALVILAAIVGDSVGYEVGRKLGPRILRIRILRKRQAELEKAQAFLRRRGGAAVFLGRFVAFFRAVMPALAGISRMHYPRFLTFNAAGGIVWGAAFVVVGYIAGDSYKRIEAAAGRDAAIAVAAIVVVAIVAWRVRKHQREKSASAEEARAESASAHDS